MAGVMERANLTIRLEAALTKALDLDTPIDFLQYPIALSLANGTGSGQVSQMWHDTRTLSASATEDLDLAGGLTNAFGVSLTFTRVKIVIIVAASANTNDVQVTRKATTGIPLFMADGDGIALSPGEFFVYGSPTAGKTVTATTDDTLTFTNSAGSTGVDYTIILIGTD